MIRPAAGPLIGMGHLYRQLAVAEAALERGCACAIALQRDAPEAAARLARAHGARVHRLAAPPSSLAEAAELAAYGQDACAVVVDGYDVHADYFGALSGGAPRVAFVDDLPAARGFCEVLINVNLDADRLDWSAHRAAGQLVLAGAQYAALRAQFRARRPSEYAGAPASIERVLVTMGGGEARAPIEAALEGLERAHFRGAVDVVEGALAPEAPSTRARASWHRGVEEMAALIAPADLAICAAGGTSWECACLGVPMLQAALYENQRPVAAALSARGVTESLGGRIEPERLARAFAALEATPSRRAEMARRGRALIDGRGALRIVDAILEGAPR